MDKRKKQKRTNINILGLASKGDCGFNLEKLEFWKVLRVCECHPGAGCPDN